MISATLFYLPKFYVSIVDTLLLDVVYQIIWAIHATVVVT